MSILTTGLVVLICSILAVLTYWKGLLNMGGALTAFVVGLIIGIEGGLIWIFLLLIFLLSAFLATKYKFTYKVELGAQQGKRGERGAINVLANGIVPVAISLLPRLSSSVFTPEITRALFVGAVAAAASDTLASEMGLLSKKTYLITDLKPVKPGTNGGVSLYGELWSFIGSGYTFLVSYIIFWLFDHDPFTVQMALLGTLIGFMSCQIDSVLGATLERKGVIGKSSVNLLSISISVTIFWVISWLLKF